MPAGLGGLLRAVRGLRAARGLGAAERAVVARPAARLLDAADLTRLERKVAPLSGLSSGKVASRREAFQRALYRDPDLQGRAGNLLGEWVLGGRSQATIRDAYERLLAAQGKVASGTVEASLQQMLSTRKARWQRLAREAGIQPPESFRLYRGVRGAGPVEELVQALEQPNPGSLVLHRHNVASWSTDPDVARAFAKGSDPAVVYRADIPVERTLADKWCDGSALMTLGADQKEVVVAAKDIEIPLGRFEVRYQGRTWTAADRHALVRAWRAEHPR